MNGTSDELKYPLIKITYLFSFLPSLFLLFELFIHFSSSIFHFYFLLTSLHKLRVQLFQLTQYSVFSNYYYCYLLLLYSLCIYPQATADPGSRSPI